MLATLVCKIVESRNVGIVETEGVIFGRLVVKDEFKLNT